MTDYNCLYVMIQNGYAYWFLVDRLCKFSINIQYVVCVCFFVLLFVCFFIFLYLLYTLHVEIEIKRNIDLFCTVNSYIKRVMYHFDGFINILFLIHYYQVQAALHVRQYNYWIHFLLLFLPNTGPHQQVDYNTRYAGHHQQVDYNTRYAWMRSKYSITVDGFICKMLMKPSTVIEQYLLILLYFTQVTSTILNLIVF